MPSVPDRKTVVRRRALVSQIKEFGQKEFGLPKTNNFSRYYRSGIRFFSEVHPGFFCEEIIR